MARDVFDLLAPHDDEVRLLNRVWHLDQSDVLAKLAFWSPQDEGDREIRRFLLDLIRDAIFEHEQARKAAERERRRKASIKNTGGGA
jgi:hypothetical protein